MSKFKLQLAFTCAGFISFGLGFILNKFMLMHNLADIYTRHIIALSFSFILIGIICKFFVFLFDWDVNLINSIRNRRANASKKNFGEKIEDTCDLIDVAADANDILSVDKVSDVSDNLSDALSASSDIASGALEADEFGIILIIPAIIIAIIFFIFFGMWTFAIGLVAEAPFIFAEIIIEGGACGLLVQRSITNNRNNNSNTFPLSWFFSYLYRIFPRYAVFLAIFLAIDFIALWVNPEAKTWVDAFKSIIN